MFVTWPLRYGPHPGTSVRSRSCSVTWPLALRLIRDVLRSRKCSSLGHWHLDSFGTFFILGDVRYLAIGAWTHPGRLTSRCSSLGHWRLDSSGTSCVPGDVRHLDIGSWTHLGRLAFREMFVTWPLAIGLIRGSEHLSGYKWHRHWLHESAQGS
ncbi:hypothetical protein Tco_1348080 [Tanacetum coccineum]